MSGSVEVSTGMVGKPEVNGDSASKLPVVVTNGEPKTNGKSEGGVVAVEGIVGVEEKDTTAYVNNYRAHKTGISHQEMVEAYTEWATAYDKDLCPGRYNGPEIAAKALTLYYTDESDRADLRILDVAAGTGRVGEELVKVGFRNMDALEPSEGMLSVLKERKYNDKSIYNVSYQCAVGVESNNDVESDIYDCLVIAGGMGEGHIPVSALDEMIRVVKPGGTIFIVMREEYLSYVKEYVNRLEPYMDKLEGQGKWKRIAREVVPHYSFNKNGIVFSYQVLSSDKKD